VACGLLLDRVLGALQLVGDVGDATASRLVAVQHLIAEIDARLAEGGLDGRAGVLAAERRLRAVVDGLDGATLAGWQAELEAAQTRLEALAGHLESLRRVKRLHGAS